MKDLRRNQWGSWERFGSGDEMGKKEEEEEERRENVRVENIYMCKLI